jgi:hypothetical protein
VERRGRDTVAVVRAVMRRADIVVNEGSGGGNGGGGGGGRCSSPSCP